MKRKPPKKKLPKDYDLDSLCSRVKRMMSGGFCKRCWLKGKQTKPVDWRALHWAHFRPRRYKRTRWILDNSASLCCGCHRLIDDDSVLKNEFFLEILGQKRFDELYWLSLNGTKPDRQQIKAELKEKIKKLGG